MSHKRKFILDTPEKLLYDIVKFYFPEYEVLKNYRPDWMRNPKTGKKLEFDVYLPEFAWAFEMQGLHHKTLYQQERDAIKKKTCVERNIKLKEIWDIRELIDLMYELTKCSQKDFIAPFLKKRVWCCFKFYQRVMAGQAKKEASGKRIKNIQGYFKRVNYILRMDKGIIDQRDETEGVRRRREAKANRLKSAAS